MPVIQRQVFGRIRRIFRRHGPAPHVFLGLGVGVFQVAAFVGDVQQVGIHAIGRTALAVLHVDRNAMGLGVFQQLLARQQIPLAPGRDHLDAGFQGIGAEFEAYLVVALAGRAMANGIGTGFIDDLDQAFGDQRPRDRGTQQIFAFVNGIGPKHREDEIAHELFTQIVNVDLLGLDAEFQRLGTRGFKLFALPQVGSEGHHFALIGVLQPFQDDRGIESTGVGQYDFFNCAHGVGL
jgi:hypothetical protein